MFENNQVKFESCKLHLHEHITTTIDKIFAKNFRFCEV